MVSGEAPLTTYFARKGSTSIKATGSTKVKRKTADTCDDSSSTSQKSVTKKRRVSGLDKEGKRKPTLFQSTGHDHGAKEALSKSKGDSKAANDSGGSIIDLTGSLALTSSEDVSTLSRNAGLLPVVSGSSARRNTAPYPFVTNGMMPTPPPSSLPVRVHTKGRYASPLSSSIFSFKEPFLPLQCGQECDFGFDDEVIQSSQTQLLHWSPKRSRTHARTTPEDEEIVPSSQTQYVPTWNKVTSAPEMSQVPSSQASEREMHMPKSRMSSSDSASSGIVPSSQPAADHSDWCDDLDGYLGEGLMASKSAEQAVMTGQPTENASPTDASQRFPSGAHKSSPSGRWTAPVQSAIRNSPSKCSPKKNATVADDSETESEDEVLLPTFLKPAVSTNQSSAASRSGPAMPNNSDVRSNDIELDVTRSPPPRSSQCGRRTASQSQDEDSSSSMVASSYQTLPDFVKDFRDMFDDDDMISYPPDYPSELRM